MANSNRVTILDNGDFSLHVSLAPVCSPVDGHALTITSQRRESRNPNEEHVRFFICLDQEGLKALQDLIQQTLDEASTQKKLQASREKMRLALHDLDIAMGNGIDLSGQRTP
jgi:hypothetical protein